MNSKRDATREKVRNVNCRDSITSMASFIAQASCSTPLESTSKNRLRMQELEQPMAQLFALYSILAEHQVAQNGTGVHSDF